MSINDSLENGASNLVEQAKLERNLRSRESKDFVSFMLERGMIIWNIDAEHEDMVSWAHNLYKTENNGNSSR